MSISKKLTEMQCHPKENRLGHLLNCITLSNANDWTWIVMIQSSMSSIGSIVIQETDPDKAIKKAYKVWKKLR